MYYEDFIKNQEQEYKEFTKDKIFYVFGDEEDLKRTLKPHGHKLEDVKPLTDGIYLLKTFERDFNNFMEQQRRQEHEYILSDLYEVIKYELWNYEVGVTSKYSYDEIITRVVGLTPEEVKEYDDVIVKAINDYKKEFKKLN